jgi:hypothetical protein
MSCSDRLPLALCSCSVASTAYVAFDQFARNPEANLMKWGFVLITAYMGPFGLLLYVMADKEPAPGTHEVFIAPLWKQGAGSTIHCCAGDATGIIVAAAVTSLLGLPMWLDLIVEYVAGLAFGLFIQAPGTMGRFRVGAPSWRAISMNDYGETGAVGYLMMGRDVRAMDAHRDASGDVPWVIVGSSWRSHSTSGWWRKA